MPTVLLVFEFLGTTELMVIALVALIIFGPRKLPEIGRTIGRSIGEFKRASDDFKRTWEYEVELESRKAPAVPEPDAARGELTGEVVPPYEAPVPDEGRAYAEAVADSGEGVHAAADAGHTGGAAVEGDGGRSIARGSVEEEPNAS